MRQTIGFAAFPKGWEGPIVLEFERYSDHSRVVRYRSKLETREFDLYVPKFLLPTGAAAEGPPRIRVAIGKSRERFRTMGFFGKPDGSTVGENICTYDLSEAKANTIRYDMRHEGQLLLKAIEADYPPEAKARNVVGAVLIEFVIDESGNVTSPRVVLGHSLYEKLQ